MYKYEIREISKEQALKMVQKYHYSNSLPKLNKHFLGFYIDEELVGVITLGWGTRPIHTIQKVFNNMTTKDYYEIGRMCMTEEMPRNSESQMLSQLIKYIKKNYKDIKILFTWADGMLGKPGYVYQASNFIYTGYVTGEMYMQNNIKIHVRQIKQLLCNDYKNEKRLTVRPTLEQMHQLNIKHYKGKQFRYIFFLCDKKEKKNLLKEMLVKQEPFPKSKDLEWKMKIDNHKWIKCEKPFYESDYIR